MIFSQEMPLCCLSEEICLSCGKSAVTSHACYVFSISCYGVVITKIWVFSVCDNQMSKFYFWFQIRTHNSLDNSMSAALITEQAPKGHQ